jgi:DNA-directed RNA polymerase specialized sigma24 family protein
VVLAEYRRALEAQVCGSEFRRVFEEIRQANQALRKYPGPDSLLALIDRSEERREERDTVVSVLIMEMRRESTVFPLLALMFWEALVGLFRRRRSTAPDAEELFVRVLTNFYETARAYPLDRRPRKVDANLLLDTMKKVIAWQKSEAKYAERHEALGPAAESGKRLAEVQESAALPGQMEAYLSGLLLHRVIDDQQYSLLLETEAHKRMTQKEWAHMHGIPEGTARSWRHRAKRAIQEYEHSRRREAEDRKP